MLRPPGTAPYLYIHDGRHSTPHDSVRHGLLKFPDYVTDTTAQGTRIPQDAGTARTRGGRDDPQRDCLWAGRCDLSSSHMSLVTTMAGHRLGQNSIAMLT